MSTFGVLIRDCRRGDLEPVCRIERDCHGISQALSRVALTQYFDLYAPAFVLAEASSEPVGFAIGGTSLDNDCRVGWILDVAVLPQFQGQGVGHALCQFVLERLAGFGVRTIYATVSPNNERSIKLLRKLGFLDVDEAPDYFGPGEARLVMERR